MEREPWVIGLTGPSGAGKSLAAERLRAAGIPVVDCDALARAVVAPPSRCLDELSAAFGAEILLPDGTLHRRRLAAIAFPDPEKRALLNAITHKHILAALEEEISAAGRRGEAVLVLDAPTLFESGADSLCRDVAVVLADEQTRRARILARDGLTQADAAARLAAGRPDAFYCGRARWVLRNDGDRAAFSSAVGALAAEILAGA